METITKIDVRTMKADIKKMVEEQKFYKSERKFGKTMHPSVAQWKHRANRQNLRIMYAAYHIGRNKGSLIMIDRDPSTYEDKAFNILTKYEIQVPVEQPQE